MGLKMESRVNPKSVFECFRDEDSAADIGRSFSEPSLCDLLIKWLERTPGLSEGFRFLERYSEAVRKYLADEERGVREESDLEKKS